MWTTIAGVIFVVSGITGLGVVQFMVQDGVGESSAGMLALEVGVSLVLILAGVMKMGNEKRQGKK